MVTGIDDSAGRLNALLGDNLYDIARHRAGSACHVGQLICERTMTRRIGLSKASPDELVRGYGTALDQILSEFAPVLGARIVR